MRNVANCGNVLSHIVDILRTSTGLSGHENGLVHIVNSETLVAERRCLVDVRFQDLAVVAIATLPNELLSVHHLNGNRVQVGQPLVRIHRNHNVTRTSVWLGQDVASFQVEKDSGLMVNNANEDFQ
jgi:hypothetical protein